MAGIISIFLVLHLGTIQQEEPFRIMNKYQITYLDTCQLDQIPVDRAPLKLYLLCVSEKAFGTPKVIPLILTTAIIPLSYLITTRITKNPIFGVITASILPISKIFSLLGPTGALSADWAFFFLASLYMVYRKPVLVGPLYFVAIAAKGVPLLCLPIFAAWIISSDTTKKQKITAGISLGVATAMVLSVWATGNSQLVQPDGIRMDYSQLDLHQLYYIFRNDLVMFPIIILSIANCIMQKQKMLLFSIIWFYSLVVTIPMFSIYMMYDYRMIPLIEFCAMALGTIPKNRLMISFYQKIRAHV